MEVKGLLSSVFGFVFLFCSGMPASGGSLYICVDHIDEPDWQSEWEGGPIHVPAGTIFDYAGHMHGSNLQDPKDDKDFDISTAKWNGVSAFKQNQWNNWLEQDIRIPPDPITLQAAITTDEIVLSKKRPCADVGAATAYSAGWKWTSYPVFGNSLLYYEILGIMRGNDIDTSFDGGTPFDRAAQLGELHAQVHGTLSQKISIPGDQ